MYAPDNLREAHPVSAHRPAQPKMYQCLAANLHREPCTPGTLLVNERVPHYVREASFPAVVGREIKP